MEIAGEGNRQKMRSFLLIVLVVGIILFSATASAACVTPTDNTYINSDTSLCGGIYNISDAGAKGIIIMNQSSVTLNCNGSIINVTSNSATEVAILANGKTNVTIANCTIYNSTYGVYLNYTNSSTVTNITYAYGNKSRTMYGVYLNYANRDRVDNSTFRDNYLDFSGTSDTLYMIYLKKLSQQHS